MISSWAPPTAGFNIYMPDAGPVAADQMARGLYGPLVSTRRRRPRSDLEPIVLVCPTGVLGRRESPISATPVSGAARVGRRP